MSDKFEIYGDGSLRARNSGKQVIVVFRPSLKWQISPEFSIHGGIGLFQNIHEDEENILEIRPWQGLRVSFPDIGPLQFKHYFRLEERYYPSLSDLLFFRGRYRIGVKIPLNKKIVQNGALFIPLASEWLGQSDDNLENIWLSEIRLTTGIGYVLNREWQFEFEFMNWWSKDLPSSEFERSSEVFRLKLIMSGWVYGE